MNTVQKLKQKYNKTEKLQHWTDLWFSKHKKAGYVEVTTNFQNPVYYGTNDVKKLIDNTSGKKGQFISLNAFNGWLDKSLTRKRQYLRQIRNIGIDIDQYDLGLTIDETIKEIKRLVDTERIPMPNLVLTSRGIQIFYSISHGASPDMAWLSEYITDQLVLKLKHIGADINAKGVSRVMRVPYSINERNNAFVVPDIWESNTYSLPELQMYCRPLDKFETRKQVKWNIAQLPYNAKIWQYYKTNYARLRDLRRLITLRQGDFTGKRNTFLYVYSYFQSLVLNTQKEVINDVKNTFKDVYSTTDRQMSNAEFERTVKSAYKNAKEFFEYYSKNGYTIDYSKNDGIKRPYKNDTLIDLLEITEEEQYQLKSIRNEDVAKKQHADYMRNKRRSQGVRPMQEYNTERKNKQLQRVKKLSKLIEQYPNATQRELAEMMEVSAMTISRLKKIIER